MSAVDNSTQNKMKQGHDELKELMAKKKAMEQEMKAINDKIRQMAITENPPPTMPTPKTEHIERHPCNERQTSSRVPGERSSCNPWNDFQRDLRGTFLTRGEVAKLYKLYRLEKDSCGGKGKEGKDAASTWDKKGKEGKDSTPWGGSGKEGKDMQGRSLVVERKRQG